MYQLQQEQILHASLDKLWQFISHPANLNQITPPEMNFSIESDVPKKMYNGLIVQYNVKLPLLGTSEWVTEIKHIVEGRQFVDEQRIGPYKFWYHYHGLEKVENGIRMTDQVSYLPPYGIFGKGVNKLFIRRQLDSIFDYRKKVLVDYFNG